MRIDVHAHHLPAKYLHALKEGNGPAMGAPHDDSTLDKMIEEQDVAGVRVQVLSTGPNSPYLRDADQAANAAQFINDYYTGVVERYNGRFAAYGSVPLPHPDAAAKEAVRCLDSLGFAGIHLGCSALGQAIDDPRFEAFWSELDQRDAIIYVHPGGVVLGSEPGLAGMDDSLIAVTIGSAAEIATATLRLAAMCQRHRRIRPIIGLLGGSLPFLLQRVSMIVGKWPGPSVLSAFSSPDQLSTALKRFYYDINLLPDPGVLESARRAYGLERLVFGSDSPSGTPASALQFLQAGGFSADDCDAILGRNALPLFENLVAPSGTHTVSPESQTFSNWS